MTKLVRIGWIIGSVALSAPILAQTARSIPGHTKTNPNSAMANHGMSVARLSDLSGDGIPEYIVGAPDAPQVVGVSLRPNGGQASVYDSDATGTLRFAPMGTGGVMPICGSGGGSSGDRLGWSVNDVEDQDGDGTDDFLVGRVFRSRFIGGCFVPTYGGFTLYSGATGAALVDVTGNNADEFLGFAVSRVGNIPGPNGARIYAVGTVGGRVDLYVNTSATPFVSYNGTGSFGSTITEAGDWNGDTLPDFAVRGDNDRVYVFSIASATPLATFQGPAGSDYGAALCVILDNPGQPQLVIGAPLAGGGTGQVDIVTPSGTLVQFFGTASSDNFGASLGTNGDTDGSGTSNVVIGAPGGNYAVVAAGSGAQATRSLTFPGTTSFGDAVDVLGDLNGDGFAELIVGDAAGNTTYVFFGGPDATRTTIGVPCSTGTPFLPVLTASADPVIGASFTFNMTGASPFSLLSVLDLGVADPVGTPFGGCLLHLLVGQPIIQVFATTTNAVGNWPVPLTISAPPDPALIGFPLGFQSITVAPLAGPPLEFTNAIDLRFGW